MTDVRKLILRIAQYLREDIDTDPETRAQYAADQLTTIAHLLDGVRDGDRVRQEDKALCIP